ncbi:sensor histidine kinase [Psychrobacter sp. FBL11]|uniref:histidine kinase n=2 Tax=Psychrobacter TaxID=497 RepID=A0ABU9X4E9_9GAMM
MQQLGFRSVFAKLFASVMLALVLFAVAMVLLTQLVHDKNAGIRSEVVATQILGQIDPFLHELNTAVSKNNRLQSRFMLAVVKKSFDIFDESLQAKMGLYDSKGRLLMQTDNSDLPLELPATPSLLTIIFPSFSETPPTQQAQVYSSTGYTLLYESRLSPKKPALSAALNLFTGTLLLLMIMAGVLWWIARSMTWRINHMSQQMSQLGDGDFTVRVNSRGNDEIAFLARGFNQAAQKIEHLIDANNLLLAHASHELRTPITRIRLQIEMMDMLAGSMPSDTKAKFDKRAQAINRDLSGLNDLVESILLVSRLDAGHAMQQVERVDLYDLVNQERQHYPEATLIGEHIVIDGQPPMLTHLIRNLLNNAMLHGVPPVTVLLYGAQTLAEADTLPEYLLDSLVCSSFADYGHSNYGHPTYDKPIDIIEQSKDEQEDSPTSIQSVEQTSSDASEQPDIIPAPVIFKNGETLVSHDEENDKNSYDHNETDQLSDISDNNYNNQGQKQTADILTSNDNSKTLRHDHYKLASDLTNRIKKVVWNIVPESQEQHLKTGALSDALVKPVTHKRVIEKANTADHKGNSAKDNNASNSNVNSDGNNTPRKESLFKKHLKKVKSEDARPLPKYAVLAVIDEGTGIPKDKREEIFSPFVRLQQKNKGSGLGLSLVSQIVTAHQGQIITDTINGHTRFLVVIPVKHNPHKNHDNRV